MAELEKLISRLEADIGDYRRKMGRAEKTAERFGKRSTHSVDKASDGLKRMASSAAILDGPLSGVAGRFSSIGVALGSVNPAMIAVTAGLGALVVEGHKSLEVFTNMERQLGRLDALITSTGGAAGRTTQDVDALTRSIARNTLQSIGQMRDAAGVLLTFKSVSGDVFSRTLALTADMAEVMGVDAKSAALQLAKALEEPEIGLSFLRRSGVSFNQVETEQIKLLAKNNQLLAAQELILKKVEGQLGGAGAGAAGGVAGAADSASQSLEELREAAGATFAPFIQRRYETAAKRLRQIKNLFFDTAEAAQTLTREQIQSSQTLQTVQNMLAEREQARKKRQEELIEKEKERTRNVIALEKAERDRALAAVLTERQLLQVKAAEAGATEQEKRRLDVLAAFNEQLAKRKDEQKALQQLERERFGAVAGAGFVLGGVQQGRRGGGDRSSQQVQDELKKQTRALQGILEKVGIPTPAFAT